MLLRDLINLNESILTVDSALSQLIANANGMASLYSGTLKDQIRKLYAEGMHEDMKRTAKTVIGRTKARWFLDNYASTSRHSSSPTQGIKNALLVLSQSPKYNSAKSDLTRLSSLPMHAGTADKRAREGIDISYSSHLTELETLPIVLDKMAASDQINKSRLQQCATRLRNSVTSFYSEWDKLHNEWDRDWGKGAEIQAAKVKDKAQKANTGQQLNQVDQLVANILSELPDKKVAHEIRTILARSDNKLQTLQSELMKRGIKF